MNHCKACKSWTKDGPWKLENSPHRFCAQEIDDGRNGVDRPNGIFYEDDGGCYGLMTGPEFGCVNFTARGE